MNSEDFFKNIGFIVFCIIFGLGIIYYYGQCMSFQTSIIEGLENKPDEVAKKNTGIAGDALASIDAIKAATVKIQDELLVDKYKADYEKKIIALDELFDATMLKFTCQISTEGVQDSNLVRMYMGILGSMKSGRDALNDVMKILDKSSSATTSSSSMTSSLSF